VGLPPVSFLKEPIGNGELHGMSRQDCFATEHRRRRPLAAPGAPTSGEALRNLQSVRGGLIGPDNDLTTKIRGGGASQVVEFSKK